ncbi:hypothetical protein J007_06371 [Cryptococcus neoformans]|nr:hypothetical protein J007_06371 [Cryptococcus neoformans var. grubii]
MRSLRLMTFGIGQPQTTVLVQTLKTAMKKERTWPPEIHHSAAGKDKRAIVKLLVTKGSMLSCFVQPGRIAVE